MRSSATNGGRTISTAPQNSRTGDHVQAAEHRPADHSAQRSADELADVQEDRRRQQELDDGEMGGEA